MAIVWRWPRLPVETDVAKVDVILPRKAVLELVKLLGDADATGRIEVRDNQVALHLRQHRVHHQGGGRQVSRLPEGDSDRLHASSFVLDRVTLQQALQRAAILSNEKFRGVRWVLTENSLRIVCSNTEQEEAEEELEVQLQRRAAGCRLQRELSAGRARQCPLRRRWSARWAMPTAAC